MGTSPNLSQEAEAGLLQHLMEVTRPFGESLEGREKRQESCLGAVRPDISQWRTTRGGAPVGASMDGLRGEENPVR